MTVIPAGYAQINWSFTGSGLPHGADVTLGVDISSYAGNVGAAALQAAQDWASNIMPFLNSAVALTNTHVKFGPNTTGPAADNGTTQAGTGATAGMSPNVTFLVHKATLFGGHAGRGRMFVPGVAETSVDQAGQLDGGTVTALQGGFDGLLNDLGTALLIPVLLHSAGSPLTTPSTIVDFTVDPKVATQRRRLRR